MYRIIKILNNNSILVFHEDRKKEYILLGNGIGFGKKTSERIENINNAKILEKTKLNNLDEIGLGGKILNGSYQEYAAYFKVIIEEK